MCIIVGKPKGATMPEMDVLEACWDNNPDGAGFMFARGDRVEVRKGFMYFNDFYLALMNHNVEKEEPCVMHFRISTSGKVNRQQTHPFPLIRDLNIIKGTSVSSEVPCVAHNGILGSGWKNLSDTVMFVYDVMSDPTIRANLTNPAVKRLINGYIGGSRLAILRKNGKILFMGEGWIQQDGLFYSNTGYKKITSYYTHGSRPYRYGKGGWNWQHDFECELDECVDTFSEEEGSEDFMCPLCGDDFNYEPLDIDKIWFQCNTCHCVFDADMQMMQDVSYCAGKTEEKGATK